MHWNAEALWQDLEPLLPGLSIEVLERTDSTNTQLLDRVRREHAAAPSLAPHPILLVAEHQTQGRGRMGRSWHADKGASLTFSLGLPLSMSDWSGLSLAVGCALADALDPPRPEAPRIQLKWPNDLWLDGRKLGGILIETVQAGSHRVAVIGVGLNITPAPAEQAAQFSTGHACLREINPADSAPLALARLARPLIEALLQFQQQGFAPWAPRYARRDLLLGQDLVAGTMTGLGAGLGPQGELLLQTAQGLQPIHGGEVSVRLRPLSAPPRQTEA